MDEKLIGFLAAHEVWMTNDTAWKQDTARSLKEHNRRIGSLEKLRVWILGACAAISAGFWLIFGNHK